MHCEKCPVCACPAALTHHQDREAVFEFDCSRCGVFNLSEQTDQALKRQPYEPPLVGLIGGYIRRNAGLTITRELLSTLPTLPMPSVGEKAARLLSALGKRHPLPGDQFMAPCWPVQTLEGKIRSHANASVYPTASFTATDLEAANYLGIAALADFQELRWMLYSLLLPQGLLKKGAADAYLEISPAGWQEIARLQEIRTSSRLGFVAMSFQPQFLPLYEHGLAPGIAAAGYEALRVDRHEHNNRIDDEIIALIKRSRFLVADFSVNRGGIYFEAGYALGLGLPVIWTVRAEDLKDVHFDTRQFNHIAWRQDDLPGLAKALQLRVEATIGRGPHSAN